MWTMEELLDRVRGALAAEYPGAPNGRIRDVPDRRAVRWYTTTGLVDRPSAMRGRTALYGTRHMLQLVALKRRQAQGHSLAAIQAELAGATDDRLAEVARVPRELLTAEPAGPQAPARPRFWATPSASTPPASTPPTSALPTSAPPTSALPTSAPPVFASPRSVAAAASTVPADGPAAPADAEFSLAGEVGGVALGGGAILLLPVRPSAADRAAVAAAARPLLDLLAARGLITLPGAAAARVPGEMPHTDDGSPS